MKNPPPMNFRDWQELPPETAAREVRRRLGALPATQARAAIAWQPDELTLAADFEHARPDAHQKMAGVPFLVKDLFDVAGAPTRAGSTFLQEVRPGPFPDSALVRAARASGMVCAGKTHLHEFAYGITGENPHYGDCEHPKFPGHTTGGSSSGSAAVVAAGVVPLAFGSDTGGSIRVPAAFCGLYGLRLSPGDAWIRDAFPLSRSFDAAGWFTANAGDMRTAVQALLGVQPDARPLRGCFVTMPGLDPEVATAFEQAAQRHADAADALTRGDLVHGFESAPGCYHTLVATEAWQVHSGWAHRFKERYDPVVWQRLSRVHALTPADLERAEAARAAIELLWTKFFLTYDYLVLPATPFAALTKAECTAESRNRLLALTAPASVGSLPVLTVPVPLPSGMTTGLQIVVNQPQSPVLLSALARAEEEALGVAA